MNGTSNSKTEAMKQRTKVFALRVIKLRRALPKQEEARIIGQQLLRSGTSVGANYRAVCRARSRKEFIAKCGVIEECDESSFWMELLIESGIVSPKRLQPLLQESNEILAILAAAYFTARAKRSLK